MIEFVSQENHEKASQQAVIAMLARVSLKEICDQCGYGIISPLVREELMMKYHLAFGETYTASNISDSVISDGLFWVRIGSIKDYTYDHSAIIYNGDLYNPATGINQPIAWYHRISFISQIFQNKRGHHEVI